MGRMRLIPQNDKVDKNINEVFGIVTFEKAKMKTFK